MRNQFICEIPDCVRDQLSRQAVEQLDHVFDELDTAADRADVDDDVDALWVNGRTLN